MSPLDWRLWWSEPVPGCPLRLAVTLRTLCRWRSLHTLTWWERAAPEQAWQHCAVTVDLGLRGALRRLL